MRRNRFSAGVGGLTAAAGVLVLLGWLLELELLKSLAPSLSSMKANTATSFVVLGAALLLGDRVSALVPAAAAFLLAVGGATLAQYFGGWSFGIDELLFEDSTGAMAGRMGANTAAGLSLLAVALLLLRNPTRGRTRAAHGCLYAVLAIASLAVTGYANGVEALYGPLSHTAMALHTALLLVLVSLAVLSASSGYGIPRIVLARTPGGRMARRLLPVAGVPIVLHALRERAETAGLVSPDVGVWLVATLVVATLVFAVVFVARVVDEAEGTRALLASVVESSGEAILTVSSDRVITSWNSGAQRLYGWSAAEAVGEPLTLLVPAKGEVDGARGLEDAVDVEKVRRHRDGHLLQVALGVWPLRDATGRIAGYGEISKDIGGRLEAQRLQEELTGRLAASNAELEQFASVASHDLREPLRKIQSFGALLTARYAPDLGDEGALYVERMSAAAGRMETLIDGVLDLSRATRAATSFERVSLARVAREVLDDLQVRIAETGARVDLGDLPELEADSLQMRQLLQNLIANALKFGRAGAPPEIVVRGKRERGVVEVTVADNGIGFDERHNERIFGPFQRLHGRGEYQGAGLGLSLCRRIVERHGGSITARSRPGEGSTFTVRLPATQPMSDVA